MRDEKANAICAVYTVHYYTLLAYNNLIREKPAYVFFVVVL